MRFFPHNGDTLVQGPRRRGKPRHHGRIGGTLRAGKSFSAIRRRWIAVVCACAWLLYAMAAALAPLPALASAHTPLWASDICSQGHASSQAPATPEQPVCPHALCCLLGCATHHGVAAAPCAPVPSAVAAAEAPRFMRTGPAHVPETDLALLHGPRGPPAFAA